MEKGFTYIELVVVLGIIAILAGGTVLSLFAYRGAQDLVFDTEGIVGVLRLAQEHAITGEAGAYWGVCFHGAPASPGYYELIKGTVCPAAPADVASRVTLRSAVEFDESVSENHFIFFDQISGLPASVSPNRNVCIRRRGASSGNKISVNATGLLETASYTNPCL